ncbi:hypothetical protein HELRODRAFT_82463 [Helobdella robusta]|uniref:Calpain catalytic domain-containing protein n=1 Tax=Helobdella robusta TaxID=6412 RepID=T1G4S5_HELRO|nr:hypothetical protein HELRODRAFT_82463 [Helobdella robusta]ESO00816.1 hypothetical protein HELRODRAFT_82463 [Helobdella robusta]
MTSKFDKQKFFSGKNYDELKAECLKNGSLFEDPDFPAAESSVFYTAAKQVKLDWLRPKVILTTEPQFIVQGATRFDIKQGGMGDCWLLAAMATLTQYPKLFGGVVPHSQSFDRDYAGIFKFNFWVFGDWKEIYVDDRIPTKDGKMIFLHSADVTEFWSALFEKAYAKLVGSYEAMDGGSMGEAYEDFTGGIAEEFDLADKPPKNLLGIMMKAYERNSLMGAAIIMPIQKANGEIDMRPMIRLRNPWGSEHEWKGKWSDGSEEWNSITDEVKKEIGLVVNDDGEFWMDFKDFSDCFNDLELCHLSPDNLEDRDPITGQPAKKWCMSRLDGYWRRKLNAGGSPTNPETFWINPQYHFEVIDYDEDDDKNEGTVIISLMQKDRRKLRLENRDNLVIGFIIFKMDGPASRPLSREQLHEDNAVEWSRTYTSAREICVRMKLPPGNIIILIITGHYCLVPSTYEAGDEGDFLIRIFSEKPVASGQIDDKTAIKECEDLATMSLRLAFEKITGKDGEMNAYQLQNLLKSVFSIGEKQVDGFSIETCKSLLAYRDRDVSGKLSFYEMKLLWDDVKFWKVAFDKYDADKSGSFNSYELREALYNLGISVSQSTFNALVQRHSSREDKIFLDDFLHLMARVMTMFGQLLVR